MPDKDYSHRDVTDKLGLKPDHRVRLIGTGDSAFLKKVRQKTGKRFVSDAATADVILYYPKTVLEIVPTLTELKTQIESNGGIWIITIKKGFEGYIKQDDLIPMGAQAGLVDNKICSISDKESAMRFVIRRVDRGKQGKR
jgi:ligand-binding sensor domain-containing protein